MSQLIANNELVIFANRMREYLESKPYTNWWYVFINGSYEKVFGRSSTLAIGWCRDGKISYLFPNSKISTKNVIHSDDTVHQIDLLEFSSISYIEDYASGVEKKHFHIANDASGNLDIKSTMIEVLEYLDKEVFKEVI